MRSPSGSLAAQQRCVPSRCRTRDTPRQSASAASKRDLMGYGCACATLAIVSPDAAEADGIQDFGFKKDMRPVRARGRIDPKDYLDGPEGLKFFDVKVGEGPEVVKGDRVVVHYECKWKGITFVTSRLGVGVTGGEPYGFDVGATGTTKALKGLDVGVQGMQKGGVRSMILPPELAYGNRGVGEIPPNATLQMEVELLSIKNSPFGYRVKVVEG